MHDWALGSALIMEGLVRIDASEPPPPPFLFFTLPSVGMRRDIHQ